MPSFHRVSTTVLVGLLALALFALPEVPKPVNEIPDLTVDFPPRENLPAVSLPGRPSLDPDLQSAMGRIRVLAAIEASAAVAQVARHFESARVLPSTGGFRIVRGTIDAANLPDLEASPYVISVIKDRRIALPSEERETPTIQPSNPFRFSYEEPTEVERDSPVSGPETTMYQVVDFTGARRAWRDLGVDGSGVTIAVVDTGVDHGAMNLGEAAVARDAAGLPSSFDPDGGTFGRTTIPVSSYTRVVAGSLQTFVRTQGTDPLIYIFDIPEAFGPYGPANVSWADPRLFAAPFPADMNITSIVPSRSGTYHFGVLAEWHLILPFIYLDLFPVLVVDAAVADVYDTVYLDLSFDWWLNGFDASPSPDLSFSDEPRLRAVGGSAVAVRDMDGDGYPDVSAGSFAHGLDIWGLAASSSARFGVLPPLDPDGNHIVMVYDWFSHGTSVAATAAGREISHPFAGPGIAPGARVMGVPIFLWGDIIEGWLWAAGFDLVDRARPTAVPGQFGLLRYGTWTYTGNHKADIISNSWGISDWLTFQWFFAWPWYDVLTVLEDALMTPGYADPLYPGTLIVHAGGNGAAGYGTVTGPGFSSLALTVGASTSLNNTALAFGGFHNDVMSWSARGPNALGAPKPDVVMVGAFAYTSAPPWSGNGSGAAAFTLFGGTSQATPAVSGAAAIAIQAHLQAQGAKPSPFVTKSILKSTADDLGYDAFAQGTGQVNVFGAAAFPKGNGGILVTSPATWDAVRPRIAAPWATAGTFYGQQVGGVPPLGPIPDASWFAGALRPGASASATFTVSPAGALASGTLSAVWHARIRTIPITGTTRNLGAGWLEGYGALVPLATTDVPAGADLLVARGSIPYGSFDPEFDYAWNNRIRILLGDWVDGNADGVTTPDEVRIFNYGFNTGTTVEARVGRPEGRFSGRPILWFSQAPAPGRAFASIPFTVQVEFYERAPWPWISIPASFSAPGSFVATMAVPPNAAPGIYEGQVLVDPNPGNLTAVPVSVVVPRVMDGSVLTAPLTSTGSRAIYDPSGVQGYFDWRWRFEAGDWRFWYVQVDDPTVIAMRVNASWRDPNTDVDLWSITPSGVPGDSSFSPYLGNGTFRWSTRTGTTEDYVVVNAQASLDSPGVGLYTFALHNVLYGSSPTPEPLYGSVSLATLNPRGPLEVAARPGATVSLRFVLTTGFPLSEVAWVAAQPPSGSTFPGTTWPSLTPLVGRGESRELWANFTVPANAPDGTYENFIILASNEFGIVVRADIVVDSTGPTVSILAPSEGAFVRGAVRIEARTEDANGVGSVTFEAGTSSGSLALDPPSNIWSGTWDTGTSPDGVQTFRVTGTDLAGNERLATRDVVVDNAPPQVTITSPASGTTLSGTATIAWSIFEANPARVFVLIDGSEREVTGNTSYGWDTLRVGEGLHTIEVRAVDKAGNVAAATVTATVSNLGAFTWGSLLTGIGIGAAIAAAVAFFLGFLFARRRRPPPAPPPPPPPGPGAGTGTMEPPAPRP